MIPASGGVTRRAIVHTSGPNLRLQTLGLLNRQANKSSLRQTGPSLPFILQQSAVTPTPKCDHGEGDLGRRERDDFLLQRVAPSSLAAPLVALRSVSGNTKLPTQALECSQNQRVMCTRGTVRAYDRLDEVDHTKLRTLIQNAFGRRLVPQYLHDIQERLVRIYIAGWDREHYDGCAVVTDEGVAMPYLDKFAVAGAAQGLGAGRTLWRAVRRHEKGLFWRSRSDNPLNSWYFKEAHGSLCITPEWNPATFSFTAFWVWGQVPLTSGTWPELPLQGSAQLAEMQQIVEVTTAKPSSFDSDERVCLDEHTSTGAMGICTGGVLP